MADSLRQNEETLRKIFDTATDAIFIKSAGSVYVKVNNFCAGLFGLTPRQMEGKSDFDIMPGELAQKLRDQDLAVIKNGGSRVADSKIKTAKGETRTFNSVKTPLYDSRGRVTGLLGIARDVTEFKKLQNRLLETLAMDAVTRVARPAAHDFNNILSAINGYATLIMETLKTGNPVKPEIEQILNAVKRAAAITERLQTYGSGTGKERVQ
jgi:PAS domain S-box-containing protein